MTDTESETVTVSVSESVTVSVDSNRVGGSKRVSFNSELDQRQRAAYTHEAQITVHLLGAGCQIRVIYQNYQLPERYLYSDQDQGQDQVWLFLGIGLGLGV